MCSRQHAQTGITFPFTAAYWSYLVTSQLLQTNFVYGIVLPGLGILSSVRFVVCKQDDLEGQIRPGCWSVVYRPIFLWLTLLGPRVVWFRFSNVILPGTSGMKELVVKLCDMKFSVIMNMKKLKCCSWLGKRCFFTLIPERFYISNMVHSL